MQWFRLYAEFAYDAKVQSLSETLQRRYVMLLCYQCNGELSKLSDDDLAFALRIGESDLEATLLELRRKRLIGDNREILGWDKRQYQSDSSNERVRRHRERKRYLAVTETVLKQVATSPDTDTDTDTDTERSSIGRTPNEAASKPSKSLARGTRLTEVWELPEDWGNWAESQGMTFQQVCNEADKFKDYWISKSGSNATKADWQATWRNWIRKHLEEYKR